jgi:NADH:ubiquinone reductase (H+-translocating)
MPRIVILGGGFAGVWSAAAAARVRAEAGVGEDELSIVLISPDDNVVIRPRLYEAHPEEMVVRLRRVLDPIHVEHIPARALAVDHVHRRVTVESRTTQRLISYEQLIVATGSQLVQPELAGADRLHNVDTVSAATALERHLHSLPSTPVADGRFSAVVVGSGFTGIEVSTELVSRLRTIATPHGAADQVRVHLIERAEQVGPELGPGPRPVITDALHQLGIDIRLGTTVTRINQHGVKLATGEELAASTTVWTAGFQASSITESLPAARDRLGRLPVDQYLRIAEVPGILAAGDTAAAQVEGGHHAMQSCQHAHAMGKVAGHNAAAAVLGLDLSPFEPDPYVTCLDLGAAGAVFTTGFERKVTMTGPPAKELKRQINRAIYPPTDNPELILSHADPRSHARTPTHARA